MARSNIEIAILPDMIMKKYLLALSALLTTVLLTVSCGEKDPVDPDEPDKPEEPVTPEEPSEDEVYPVSAEVNPFTWIAIDDNGNQIDPDLKRYQSAAGRSSKQVGIFYFLWHGCHGYDVPANKAHLQLNTTHINMP